MMSEPSDPRPGLAAGSGGLERSVREDLEKMQVESLLARQDAVDDITRQIEDGVRAPLALAEVGGVLDRLEGPVLPSFDNLKDLLVGPDASGLKIEKNLLTDLLRVGTEGQGIIKKGLVFLKHKKYAEAVEWWTLHRQGLDPKISRLHLLLLMMECLTYYWAGDGDRAARMRDQVRAHPLFRAG